MEWIKAGLYTASSGIEPVFGVLMDEGVSGAQIEDASEMKRFIDTNPFNWDYVDDSLLNVECTQARIIFYLSHDTQGEETLRRLEARFSEMRKAAAREELPELGSLRLETAIVDDADWLNEWKKHYKPFTVGEHVVIRPVWESYDPKDGETVFVIDPGHVFGTGLHASTRLCIAALEKYVCPGARVLDIGCGSGILFITALLLGAGSVQAVDIDPAAAGIAERNAELNGLDTGRWSVLTGDVLADNALRNTLPSNAYNIVTANIVADIVAELSGFAAERLAPGGLYVCSGIIDEKLGGVLNALTNAGFSLLETREEDGWACVVAQTP